MKICIICLGTWKFAASVRAHEDLQHVSLHMKICGICPSTWKFAALSGHMKICSICPGTWKFWAFVWAPENLQHLSEHMKICRICPSTWKFAALLRTRCKRSEPRRHFQHENEMLEPTQPLPAQPSQTVIAILQLRRFFSRPHSKALMPRSRFPTRLL